MLIDSHCSSSIPPMNPGSTWPTWPGFHRTSWKPWRCPQWCSSCTRRKRPRKNVSLRILGGQTPPVRIVFWSRKPGVLTGQGKLANSYRDCFTLFFSWLKPWWNTVEAQFHHFYGETMVTPTFFLLGVVFALNAKKTTIAVQHCHIRLPRYHRGTQWYS